MIIKMEKVKIIHNCSGHGFEIGEEVQLIPITDDEFKATNGVKTYWIDPEDFETIRK
jgi:hypothetical protein